MQPTSNAESLQHTPYFDSLIDDFGIWQHADGTKPLREHGYALDDATRGFLFCLALGRDKQAEVLFNYILHSRKGTDFYGFIDSDRKFIQFPASEDAKGQVVWAMGYASSKGYRKREADELIKALTPSLLAMQSLRGLAYTLLGTVYTNKMLAHAMQQGIARRFQNVADDWFWPEDTLTYANGAIPYALLRYALLYDDTDSAALGRKILEFVEYCCTLNRMRGPIGNVGWFSKGDSKPSEEGEQPIDAAYMVWAWLCAYQLSNDNKDLEHATLWMNWFEGNNIAHERLYDPVTLKTFDGIHSDNPEHHSASGINLHSGAESNICFLLSKYMFDNIVTL